MQLQWEKCKQGILYIQFHVYFKVYGWSVSNAKVTTSKMLKTLESQRFYTPAWVFFFYWSSAWCLNVRQPTKCLQRKEDKKCVLPARKPLIMLFVMSQNKIKRLLWSGEHESLPVLRGIKTNTTTLTELHGEREQEREGGRVRQGGLLREERSF